jgi:endonuclease/exonuclease/phosphatase family metal-dependent hydrolase
MKRVRTLLTISILIVNILTALTLLLSAYSAHITPEKFPMLSCAGLLFPFFLLANICFIVLWLIFLQYRYMFVSIVAILISFPYIRTYCPINLYSKDVPAARIKILSYNVMSFDNMKKIKGENTVLQYLAKSNADIVCLQEYATSHSTGEYVNEEYIQSMMKNYPYQDVSVVGNNGNGNKLALFSRFPILSSHRISYQSNYNGSVCYELAVNGDTVMLINNHLESNKLTLKDREQYEGFIGALKNGNVHSDNVSLLRKFADASALRASQARVIARVIAMSPHQSIIVCGDFNDSPLSYAHQVIGKQLKDAFTQSGSGLGISFNRNKFFFRIDNILISKNLQSYNCTVDRSIKSSDHYPIWCYLCKEE